MTLNVFGCRYNEKYTEDYLNYAEELDKNASSSTFFEKIVKFCQKNGLWLVLYAHRAVSPPITITPLPLLRSSQSMVRGSMLRSMMRYWIRSLTGQVLTRILCRRPDR